MENMKDWTGNENSVFKMLGASNHTEEDRETNDYYATEPKAAELLLTLERFSDYILEPACGEGHLSKVFERSGYNVLSTDLVYRGYGAQKDFFDYTEWHGDIITNPPYKYALEFVRHALEITSDGNKIAMFLKLQFLEGKERKKLFIEQPPKTVYVSSSRLLCAKNGDFDKTRENGGSAVAYGWFVWKKGYKGDTILKWFN
jgi:hypothetical protein